VERPRKIRSAGRDFARPDLALQLEAPGRPFVAMVLVVWPAPL
jgi:hypothetical protein